MYYVISDQSKPFNVSVKALCDTNVSVQWKAALGDVTGYMIKFHCKSSSPPSGSVQVTGKHNTSQEIGDLLPGETYTVTVSSLNGNLLSPASPTAGIVIQTSKGTSPLSRCYYDEIKLNLLNNTAGPHLDHS